MPRILGMELTSKQAWIGGGLIAAAVAVVVYLRSRSAAAVEATPAPATEGYGAGGMSVPAPTVGIADQYQQAMQNSELEANAIANKYQSNLVAQQQKQFDFQFGQQEKLAPAYLKEQQSELAAGERYYNKLAKTPFGCPGHQKARRDASGQLTCQSTSGGNPVTQLYRAVEGVLEGAAAAAPSIGYEAAKGYAQYYTGKTFSRKAVVNPSPRPKVGTPPISGGNVYLGGTGGYDI